MSTARPTTARRARCASAPPLGEMPERGAANSGDEGAVRERTPLGGAQVGSVASSGDGADDAGCGSSAHAAAA
eukprot:8894743-Alexandrium_andersonii.AAC.1